MARLRLSASSQAMGKARVQGISPGIGANSSERPGGQEFGQAGSLALFGREFKAPAWLFLIERDFALVGFVLPLGKHAQAVFEAGGLAGDVFVGRPRLAATAFSGS